MYISSKLGFMSTSNFVLTMFIFFLYLMLFAQNVKISSLKEKNRDLVQKLSIRDYEEYLEMKKKQETSREKNENWLCPRQKVSQFLVHSFTLTWEE